MNKNYYEILEIDKNASSEIIKKAYSTLAKKYHPDLQSDDKKQESEATFKLINEAYETLCDEEKRKQYDKTLIESTISKEDFDAVYQENEQLKYIINQLKNRPINQVQSDSKVNNNVSDYNEQQTFQDANTNYVNNINSNYYKDYENSLKQAYEQAYHDAYIQDLKNRGYKIRYKKTFKERLKNLIAILLTLFILWFLLQLPFVQKFIHNSIITPFL